MWEVWSKCQVFNMRWKNCANQLLVSGRSVLSSIYPSSNYLCSISYLISFVLITGLPTLSLVSRSLQQKSTIHNDTVGCRLCSVPTPGSSSQSTWKFLHGATAQYFSWGYHLVFQIGFDTLFFSSLTSATYHTSPDSANWKHTHWLCEQPLKGKPFPLLILTREVFLELVFFVVIGAIAF